MACKGLEICTHPLGGECIANVNGNKCIALKDTRFENKDCPFFKDKSKMDKEQIELYELTFKKGKK